MTLRGILIPADLDQPIRVVDVGDCRGIAKAVAAQYVERVRCVLTHDLNLTLAVDEEGWFRDHPLVNSRARMLYPGALVGDVLVLRESFAGGGMDWVDLAEGAQAEEVEGILGAALSLVEAFASPWSS